MDDSRIVTLYWDRDQRAVEETAKKYGPYCYSIAQRILGDQLDAEECVNDTYHAAWASIPPHKPAVLSTYLGKLTRRISLKVLRSRDTQKRGCGQVALSLEELGECIPSGRNVEEGVDFQALVQTLNSFLATLPADERRVFVCRYWHVMPIPEICSRYGFSKSKVESMLHRTRSKLENLLIKEGYDL